MEINSNRKVRIEGHLRTSRIPISKSGGLNVSEFISRKYFHKDDSEMRLRHRQKVIDCARARARVKTF